MNIWIEIITRTVIADKTGEQFEIWGDSVNVASKMESSAIPGEIHIFEQTKNYINNVN